MNTKIFDNGGILNKNKLKEIINYKYKKFKNNLENNKNAELLTKDKELSNKNAELSNKNVELSNKNVELANKNVECDTKIKDILKKEYQVMEVYKKQLDNDLIKYKEQLYQDYNRYTTSQEGKVKTDTDIRMEE